MISKMNEERLYRVWAHHCVTHEQLEHLVKVTTGEDIIRKVNDSLLMKCEDQHIIDEIYEITKCEGCQIAACGQRDHMEHPDGCLHQPSDCDLCQLQLKIS